MKVHHILAALVAVCAVTVSAQTLTGVKVEPAQAKVGESVKLTAELEVKDGSINCGLLFNWGDGTSTYEQVNQVKDVPRIGTHAYAKAGTYTVSVEPTKASSSLKCAGKDIKTTVVVAAPAPVAAPAKRPRHSPAPPRPTPSCPKPKWLAQAI
jgi:hypothetical protein